MTIDLSKIDDEPVGYVVVPILRGRTYYSTNGPGPNYDKLFIPSKVEFGESELTFGEFIGPYLGKVETYKGIHDRLLQILGENFGRQDYGRSGIIINAIRLIEKEYMGYSFTR